MKGTFRREKKLKRTMKNEDSVMESEVTFIAASKLF